MIAAPALYAVAATPTSSVNVLVDIVIVLAVCVFFGLIAQRLGQSVLVGYLLAGVTLGGPASLGVVRDISSFSFMGEVGIALLLFTVGLDLPFEKVRRFGRMALVAGGLQVVLTTALTALVAMGFGLELSEAIVIGFAVSMSSTAVVISVLIDRAETDSVHGLIATGMLIAQDVIVVLLLLVMPLLPAAQIPGGHTASFIVELSISATKLVALIAVIIVVERVIMRRIFLHSSGRNARELLAISSLTVSLGAIGACWVLDLSPALGGFIAGLVMADAAYAPQVRSEIAPIRMGLVALFFAYVGMIADAKWLVENLPLVLIVVTLTIVGKALIVWVSTRIARVPSAPSIITAASLSQLGEFSFAVLTAGAAVALVSDEAFRLIVSVSLLTLLLTPLLIAQTSRSVQRRLLSAGGRIGSNGFPENGKPSSGTPLFLEPLEEHEIIPHAIVVGAGPAGRKVISALADEGVSVTVIELNPRAETHAAYEAMPPNTRVVFGDAARPEILDQSGINTALIAVLTIPDTTAIRTIISQCRQIKPGIRLIARGRYNRYVDDLRLAGADLVIDEEHHIGSQLAEASLTEIKQTAAWN